MSADRQSWLVTTGKGLYCVPADFYIDPSAPVDRAIITHGHSDHARPGHGAVLATAETIAIMKVRYGAECAGAFEPQALGDAHDDQRRRACGSRRPATSSARRRSCSTGRGSAPSSPATTSARADPTCAPFELVPCDVFVTEATFALPVFRHEPAARRGRRACWRSHRAPARAHASRRRLRPRQMPAHDQARCATAGYDRPIYLHGALVELCELYQRLGVDLGELRPVGGPKTANSLPARIVLCPPSALDDRWSRRFADPVTAFASRLDARAAAAPASAASSCRWSSPITPTGRSCSTPSSRPAPRRSGSRTAARTRSSISSRRMGRKARALALVGREDEAE